jgi:outer membrane biosynthesis protein TonB
MTEFDDVIRLLREQRPEATALELDQIKQRVRRSAEHRSRRNQPMKSRLAILGTLVVGMLFTTTGATLAVTGLGSGTTAATDQYGQPTPQPTPSSTPSTPTTPPSNQVTPPSPSPSGSPSPATTTTPPASTPSAGVLGETKTQAPKKEAVAGQQQNAAPATAKPAAQVQAAATKSTGSLPFTGFAAIPILFGGLLLLGGGLVLRSRAGEH